MNKWKSNASLTDSRDFSSYDDVIFNAGTAIRRRGVSCLELRGWLHDENENSLSSDSNLQRMRCLSTTINDMKTVRQKQEERKNNMGDLLNDDFWKEHARKLKDAREKIRKLEERYIQRSQGARCSKLDVSSCDQKGSSSFRERNELESSCTHAGFASELSSCHRDLKLCLRNYVGLFEIPNNGLRTSSSIWFLHFLYDETQSLCM